MVINKVFGITSILELAKMESKEDAMNEYLNKALNQTQELVNWIKFLQIAHDLKTFISLPGETQAYERRREMRFPLPEIYQKYIILKINISGIFVPVILANFSQHGLQFICSQPLEADSVKDCVLVTSQTIGRQVYFKARVRHCAKQNEEYIVGAQIEEISDSASFDFFTSVHDYILEVLIKQE